jgi:uncharacterized cupredoxin-like copper-binding protein
VVEDQTGSGGNTALEPWPELVTVSSILLPRKKVRKMLGSRHMLLIPLAVVAVLLPGCSSDDDGSVTATLADFSIDLSSATGPAGTTTFAVDNTAATVHEFVVARTDLADDALPTGDDGDVSEEGATDLTVVDEIEDIAGGASPSLVVELTAGHYVVFCNLPGHYRQGMHTSFDVS